MGLMWDGFEVANYLAIEREKDLVTGRRRDSAD
jgi:hypothetical protein